MLTISYPVSAQDEDFFVRNAVGGNKIYYVSFSELLNYPKKLDGKNISVLGYCAKIFKNDDDLYLFISEEAADHISVRDTVALRHEHEYSKLPTLNDGEYKSKLVAANNAFCNIQGRYSLEGVEVLGVPTHGTLYVNYLDKGMMREDSLRNKPQQSNLKARKGRE